MKRRLFNLLAGISLILFVAMVALWVRSYSKAEDLVYFGRSGVGAVHDARGRIALVFTNAMWSNPHFEYYSSTPDPRLDFANPPRGPHTLWNRLGFYCDRTSRPRGSNPQFINTGPDMTYPPVVGFTDLAFPFWLPLLLLALLPLWNFVLPLLRAARRKAGYCAKCGYDLRATPDAGGALVSRCPECGSIRTRPEES